MTAYRVVLFVHLCALFAAFGASTLIAFAMRRIRVARVAGEALQWLGVVKSAAPVFPVAILTLVATGAYMVHETWHWDAAFVDVGIAGVVFLGVVGDRVEGGRAKAIAHALAADPGAPIQGRTAALVRDPLWWTASLCNPAVALAVAFVMVTKPGLAGAVASLVGAVVVGALCAVPLWRREVGTAESAVTAE